MPHFTAIFLEQRDALRRFILRRVNDRELAEDLVQETWVRAAGHDLSAVGNLRAYLFRIASNLSLDHLRRTALNIEVAGQEDAALEVQDPRPSPEMESLYADELRGLVRALAQLPQRPREVFVLHRLQGLDYAQIADRLGIAKSTAMVHMARAMAMLDRQLNPESRLNDPEARSS